MITCKEFLDGESLEYRGCDKKKREATYRTGVGVIVTRGGRQEAVANVTDDSSARRCYHNLVRNSR